MHFAYPIQYILMYFAILLAPPDVDKVTIEMPDHTTRIEFVRNGQTWESEGNALAVEGGALVKFGPDGRESLKITDFVALPGDHDWNKNPKFTLNGGTTLEKVATGFTIRRNAAEGEGNGVYQIRHHRPVSVNVLGEVVNQGVHAIRADGTVQDAVTAAGGPSAAADMKRVSIIRGPAGSVPEVTTVDLTKTEASGPRIQAGDTIHVPKTDDGDPGPAGSQKIGILVEQWLAGVDAGDYARSWNESAVLFQNAITAEAWNETLVKFRKPLGAVKSRKTRDMKVADALPGAPDGKYWIIQFDSSFAGKEKAVETVTLMMEKDGTWKAAGYFIR